MQWGFEFACLAIAMAGAWLYYIHIWKESDPPSPVNRILPPRVHAAAVAGSGFFLGGALVFPGSAMIHPKISVLGVIGVILVMIGILICLASVVVWLSVWFGKTPMFLRPPSERKT
jgi:predicted RND superfamily exporter protein